MKKNQTIKCDVTSCAYNDCKEKVCNLSHIKVSSTTDNDECKTKKETICDSFEENS